MLTQRAAMWALRDMTSRILPPWISLPSILPCIPIWNFRPCNCNLLFTHPQVDSGMTKLRVEETHLVINYCLGPLNDAVCQMERGMRWETWSTTCGVIRSIRLLAVSWLPWQHPCYRALWLCEEWICGSLWESVLRLKDLSPKLPGTVLSLLSLVKGENMTLHFEAVGLCGSKVYFNAGLWGVGNWKSRTGFTMAEDWH